MEGVPKINKKRILSIITVIALIAAFLNFYTLPYYVTRPGMAMELDTVIDVENGTDADGKFMLTTVRMGKANLITYSIAKMNKYYEIFTLDQIRYENEDDEEYRVRQSYLMESSQENALQVAFERANKHVEVKYNGIFVLGIIDGSPAENILKPGDRIISVDGNKFERSSDFTNYIQSKQEGDAVQLKIIRDGDELTKEITLKMIEQIGKVGVGISLVEDKEVITEPDVSIDTEDIGGPSAGLMFSLEIYNQLVEEDITKGYLIAGTGTIDPEGKVGPIGGVEQKIVAAHKSGAEIFFAPNENGKKDSDYERAVLTAKDIKTDMVIVPVDTFDDALNYLKSLEEKK